MAITMMVTADHANDPDVKIMRNYFGHEENRMSHSYDCPHSKDQYADMSGKPSPECGEHCHPFGPLYLRTSHVGMVVRLVERNQYSDSDFYAVVYDPELDRFREIEYGTTRFWTYPNHAEVDASVGIIAEYRRREELARERELYRLQCEEEEAAKERALEPAKGKRAKISGGKRNAALIGTEGMLIWVGPALFRHRGTRVGLKTADGTIHWLDANHITVIVEESVS